MNPTRYAPRGPISRLAAPLGAQPGVLALWAWLCATLVALPARADSEACLHAHEQAQIERMHGRYVEARDALLSCAQDACPAGVRADCKEWLREVDASLPSLVFAVSDANGHDLLEVRVSAAGTLLSERADGRSLALNPGRYTLRFEAEGYLPEEQQVLVREAEKSRIIRVSLRPAEGSEFAPFPAAAAQPGPSERTASEQRTQRLLLSSYVLGGAALASLAVGIGFGVSGHNKYETLEDSCAPDCPPGDAESGKRRYVVADVAFAAAGAFGISAAVTLGLGLHGARADRRARALQRAPQLALNPHGGFVSWRLPF